ncbi:hypothetical protein [Maribacter forsetii]|uniref:hypothetical protein n=1 Tax=Maribacter forsetii TaxID=444515 RepID=UPI0005654EED|nr:hypothetical protein [Maribacter forsetii]
MKSFLSWITSNKTKEKLFYLENYKISELPSKQDFFSRMNLLISDDISSIALSSIDPAFLEAKEEDLTLSHALTNEPKISNPFHFRITKYSIANPISFRLRLTFSSNESIYRYEALGANLVEISNIWHHLISHKECSKYKFDGWNDKSNWYTGYLLQRKAQEKKELENPPLLTNVYWNFSGNTFKNKEEFIATVHDYHLQIGKKWESNNKTIAVPVLIISYQYIKENKTRTGKMTLKNTEAWTEADLLLAIHNKCATKIQNQYNCFIEGLLFHDHNKDGIPTYFLNLGN